MPETAVKYFTSAEYREYSYTRPPSVKCMCSLLNIGCAGTTIFGSGPKPELGSSQFRFRSKSGTNRECYLLLLLLILKLLYFKAKSYSVFNLIF